MQPIGSKALQHIPGEDGMPVFGSCAGMILLADEIADPATDLAGEPQQAFGGLDITVRRAAWMSESGRSPVLKHQRGQARGPGPDSWCLTRFRAASQPLIGLTLSDS